MVPNNDSKNTLNDMKTIPSSEEEKLAIKAIDKKISELNILMQNIQNCILKLDKLTNRNELVITTTFDDIIRFAKNQKKSCINKLNDIIKQKENTIINQINDLKLYEEKIENFNEKAIKIKTEKVMNKNQINDFILNRTAT
eukprot:271890_1